MDKIRGNVASGLGNASQNFKTGRVEGAVAELLGVEQIVSGTLNIEIPTDYSAIDNGVYDKTVEESQYNRREWVKIKRCMVNGYRSAIVRPREHFEVAKFRRRIEVMSSVRLRDEFGLADDAEVELQLQGDESSWDESTLQQRE